MLGASSSTHALAADVTKVHHCWIERLLAAGVGEASTFDGGRTIEDMAQSLNFGATPLCRTPCRAVVGPFALQRHRLGPVAGHMLAGWLAVTT